MANVPLDKFANDVTPQDGSTFELLSIRDIEALPPLQFLVQRWMTTTAIAVMYGSPGTYKSFLALDLALSLSAELPTWHGHKLLSGSSLYIAGEGVGGVKKRITAWRQHHDLEVQGDFHLIRQPLSLLNPEDVQTMVRTVERRAPVTLTVIDTLARTFHGGDENSASDMSAYVGACERIRDATQGAVLVIHHSGKDQTKGSRGSIALPGGVDALFEVSGAERIVTMKNTRQKDADDAAPLHFEMLEVEIGQDDDGEPITSLVPIRRGLPGPTETAKTARPPKSYATARTELLRLMTESSRREPVLNTTPIRCISRDDWRKALASRAAIETTEAGAVTAAGRKAFQRICEHAQDVERIIVIRDEIIGWTGGAL